MLISKSDMSNCWQIYRVEIYFIFAGVWEVTFVNFDFKKTKKTNLCYELRWNDLFTRCTWPLTTLGRIYSFYHIDIYNPYSKHLMLKYTRHSHTQTLTLHKDILESEQISLDFFSKLVLWENRLAYLTIS